jgi:hypothetical protein
MQLQKKWLDELSSLALSHRSQIFIRANSESFDDKGFEAISIGSIFGQ